MFYFVVVFMIEMNMVAAYNVTSPLLYVSYVNFYFH